MQHELQEQQEEQQQEHQEEQQQEQQEQQQEGELQEQQQPQEQRQAQQQEQQEVRGGGGEVMIATCARGVQLPLDTLTTTLHLFICGRTLRSISSKGR